jgi:hypothetical protein
VGKKKPKLRGFARLTKEERHAVAVKGGLAAKNRYKWSSDEAKVYGRKGGKIGGKAPKKRKKS